MFDLKCLTVYIGYWTSYYTNTKRPKNLSVILQELFDSHKNSKKKKQSSVVKPDVDVDAFLLREEQFNRRLKER